MTFIFESLFTCLAVIILGGLGAILATYTFLYIEKLWRRRGGPRH